MNLRILILLPAISLISSCDFLNDPVYFSSASQVSESTQDPLTQIQGANAVAPIQTTSTQLPVSHSSVSSSPFMQPDVLAIPDKEDLKETATSTHNSGTSGGLTVPGP